MARFKASVVCVYRQGPSGARRASKDYELNQSQRDHAKFLFTKPNLVGSFCTILYKLDSLYKRMSADECRV